ncbi:MAG TPA: M28 family peptidase [Anaerolineaceae bacterium]|nr:M28 family peptidase [Anaerolineaceae bacterium]
MKKSMLSILLMITIFLPVVANCTPMQSVEPVTPTPPPEFSGERAYMDVDYQVSLGPRTPGSEAHEQAVGWMMSELEAAGWQVEPQPATMMDHPITNVIAKRGSGDQWIVLGAHYDSRFFASEDDDPELRSQPVPGANDGASGVAVLLELARVLPEIPGQEIWLVMFDAEDQGNIEGWDWILGSYAFVDSLNEAPDAAVIVDMIGDADLNIYRERNSNAALMDEIWAVAAELGYKEQFIPEYKYSILDDHMPFLQKGIPAVDLIDFDYPYWHTTSDTADKVSPASLEAVGRTLFHWLTDPDVLAGLQP